MAIATAHALVWGAHLGESQVQASSSIDPTARFAVVAIDKVVPMTVRAVTAAERKWDCYCYEKKGEESSEACHVSSERERIQLAFG